MKKHKLLLTVVLISFFLCAGIYFSYKSYLDTLKAAYKINKNIFHNQSYKVAKTEIYSDENVLIYKDIFFWTGKINHLSDEIINSMEFLNTKNQNYDFVTKKIMEYTKFDEKNFRNILLNQYINQFLDKKVKNKFPDYIFAKMFLLQDLIRKYGIEKVYLDVLNYYKYNDNIIGIEGAANYFFGKDFSELNLREKLYLIVLTFKNKYKDINRAIDGLLYQLLNNKLINKEKFDENFNKPICFNVQKPFKIYDYLVDTVLKELEKRKIDYKHKNLKIKTTVNLKLSNQIDCLIQSAAKKTHKLLRSAFILIDNNKIVAIAGDKNATVYKRQIGSIFKPIVYLTAFENGIKPNDFIIDKPYTFKKHGKTYKPKNYEDFFMGKTYVKNGMIYSLNNATVRLAEITGFEKVANTAVKMGLTSVKPYLAMPLGVIPFTPLSVAKAYTTIFNDGIKKDISVIDYIYDNDLKKNIEFLKKEKRIVSKKAVNEVKKLMQKVVEIGTARKVGLLEGTLGKTGTTNESRDAWFLGIYKKYLGICWVGFNSMKPIGDNASGGHTAAPIFLKVQKKFMQNSKRN